MLPAGRRQARKMGLDLDNPRVRAEFEHQATHDSLTNALTRRQLREVCAQELERCNRHGRVMSVLLM